METFSLRYLIRLVIKKGKLLGILTFGAAAISALIAFILPVYYASTAIVYPYSPKSYDPRMLFGSNMELFGNGEDADRVLSIANSGEVAYYIISKYRLMERYGIDSTDRFKDIKVTKEFQQNLSIRENDKGAIEITMLDRTPDTAAIIVNDIIDKIDEINKRPVLEANKKQFETYFNLMKERYNGLDSLSIILSEARKRSAKGESELITAEMFSTYNKLKESRVNLELLGDDFKTLNIIERAYPVIKKAKPVRSLIVAVATLSTFIVSLLALAVWELYLAEVLATTQATR